MWPDNFHIYPDFTIARQCDQKLVMRMGQIEKQRREEEMKQLMKNDNQVQTAINVIKGIRVYKKNSISGN